MKSVSNILYPRTGDRETIYLKAAVTDPNITVGDFTMYNDFVHDPRLFEKNNVLYHYPINHDRLVIGKFCSLACGVKFLFTSANHSLASLSTYPFPIFFEEWGLDVKNITQAWDRKGDIIVGNDVWLGYESIVLSGVTIGDGAIVGARAERTSHPTPLWAAFPPAPSESALTPPSSTPCFGCGGGTGPLKGSAPICPPFRPGG